MVGRDGITALGGTADRRPAVDPTALPVIRRWTFDVECWMFFNKKATGESPVAATLNSP